LFFLLVETSNDQADARHNDCFEHPYMSVSI
jgi:hypothetical protein